MLNPSKSSNHVKWYIALLFGQIACQLLAETGQTILLPQAPDAFGVQQQQSASWPEVFAKTKQSVVQIFCFSSPFSFQTPFKTGDLQQCRGSGFFVQLGGQLLVLTNYHVVDEADVIYLQHPDAWKEYTELTFVGGSPEFDIACLAFKPGEQKRLEQKLGGVALQPLVLGDSDKVKQGEDVMVIGFPLGVEHIKHAVGSISGHEQTFVGECFTTTAPTFPGNSGGCCVDKTGAVIGILVAGHQQQGYNYILPISREKVVLEQLQNGRVLPRPFWGLMTAPTTPETFAYLGVKAEGGLLVTSVHADSLVGKAGVQKGDVITAIHAFGKRMIIDRFGYVHAPWSSYKMELMDVFGRIAYDASFTLEVWRGGVEQLCIVTKTSEMPFKTVRKFLPFQPAPDYEVFAGCVVMPFTMNHYQEAMPVLKQCLEAGHPDVASWLSLVTPDGRKEPRLIVTHVFPETTLARNRVFSSPLNILEAVNGQKVRTMDDYRQAMQLSFQTGSIVFETMDGLVAVLDLAQVLEQELGLAQKYNYQPASSFLRMVKQVPA